MIYFDDLEMEQKKEILFMLVMLLIMCYMKNEKSYRPLNFGSANSLSIKNVAYKIAQIMDYLLA